MDYDFIFYCANCNMPVHLCRIVEEGYRCECGGTGFISMRDFDIKDYEKHLEEYI